MADWTDLKAFVSAGASEDAVVTDCYDVAVELVMKFIGTAVVPASVTNRAILVAGAELYNQKKAPNGIAQFASYDGQQAVRVARNPMVGVYPLLSPFMVMGL